MANGTDRHFSREGGITPKCQWWFIDRKYISGYFFRSNKFIGKQLSNKKSNEIPYKIKENKILEEK